MSEKEVAEKIINDPTYRKEWGEWLKEQLDTTNNASYTQTGTNRVFLDDIDIARYVLTIMDNLIEKLP